MGSLPVSWGSYRATVLGFAIAVAYVPGLFSAASMPRWWALALGLPLVSRLDLRRLDPDVLVFVAAGLIWSAATLFFAPPGGGLALLMMCLLVLTMMLGAELENIAPAIDGLGWGVAVSAVLALGQALELTGSVPYVGRPGGLFLNSEVLAELAALIFVWAFFRRRFALIFLMLIPLGICHSRVAILVAVAGLVFGWRPESVWPKRVIVLGIAVLVAGVVVMLGPVKLQSAFDRVLLWNTAVLLISIPGQGLGWWFYAHPDPFQEFVHSDVLQTAVEIGAASLFFVMIPIKAFRKGNGDVAERATFFAACLEVIISFPLHLPASGFLVAVLAGHLVRNGGGFRPTKPHR